MSKNNQQKRNTKSNSNQRTRKSWTMPKPPSEARPVHTPKPTQGKPKPEFQPQTPKPQADKPKK